MVLRGNECIVETLTLAANDGDLRSWSKVALRSRWFHRRYLRKERSWHVHRSPTIIRFAWVVLLDCSRGNVANAIMIRKVPKATTKCERTGITDVLVRIGLALGGF